VPSLAVELTMVRFKTPPLCSSMLTFAPGAPLESHVIVWLVPCCQLSPPLGAVTVIEGAAEIEKLLSLQSLYTELAAEVMQIR